MAIYRYCSCANRIFNLILHSIFLNWFNTGLANFLWNYIRNRLWVLLISSIDNTAGLARSKKKSVEPFYNVLRSAFLWPGWTYRENFKNKKKFSQNFTNLKKYSGQYDLSWCVVRISHIKKNIDPHFSVLSSPHLYRLNF